MYKKMIKIGQNNAKSLKIAQNLQIHQKSLFFEKFQKSLEGLYGREKSENYEKCQNLHFFNPNPDISKYFEGYMLITPI